MTTLRLGIWPGANVYDSYNLSRVLIHIYRTQGVTPWDAGGVQPSLIEVVEQSGLSLPTSGRALVPGCGTVSVLRFLQVLHANGQNAGI